MPYSSKAQERWAHTPAGVKALGGKNKVKEWDTASKGKKLPKKVKKPTFSQVAKSVKKSQGYK